MPSRDIQAGVIHYETAGPQDGRPVVFVHGYAMGASLWRPLAERLAARGLRCIAPTWPLGAHPEPMRSRDQLTLPGIAGMVGAFLAELDLEDVVLVGNDTGGLIAQIVSVDHPERVGALVLTSCDAFEHFPPPVLSPLIRASASATRFRLAMAPMRIPAARRRAFGGLAHADIDDLVTEWLAPGFADREIAEDLRALTASLDRQTALDAAAGLGWFTKPALVAWSADDAFFPLEDGRRLAAALPNGRLETIYGARTFSMIDKPDRLAALVAELAGRVTSGAAGR